MKKALIAGAASVALAAMPVLGVFAADATLSHTDTINLTVDSTCTLGTLLNGAYTGTDATTHDHGTYDNPKSSDTETLGAWTVDALALTMQPGTSSENIGTTTFTVRCNNDKGYELKAAAGSANLVKENSEANIPGAVPAADTSYWAFKLSDASTGGMTIATGFDSFKAVPTTATQIAKKSTAGNVDAGETVKVTYAAGVSKTQESGLYTGTVVYTLSQLN